MKISADVRRQFVLLAPGALKRLRAHGYRERRIAAWEPITGAFAPVFGLLVLDWPEATAAVCLCLNLAIILAGDWLRLVAAPLARRAISIEATHDRFVFRVGSALSRGRRWVHPNWTPSLAETENPRLDGDALILAPIGFGPLLFAAWLIQTDSSLHAEPATLVFGTLPTAMLVVGALATRIIDARRYGQHTCSVRMQTALVDGMTGMLVGMFTLLQMGMISPDPLPSNELFLYLSCIAVAGVGVWRLAALHWLRRTAAWMQRHLAEYG